MTKKVLLWGEKGREIRGCPQEASNFSDGRTQKNLNPNKVEKLKATKLGRFQHNGGLD